MFDEIFAGLSHLQNELSEAVQDQFGMSIIRDILEPIRTETHSLVLMHEQVERSLANLENMREEIRMIR